MKSAQVTTAHSSAIPRGLAILGFAEACERFSYYSMQTLLVLYMVNYLLIAAGWTRSSGFAGCRRTSITASRASRSPRRSSATYTALVYGTPILGGIIADKWLGRNTTLIIGGILMAIGHFLMAIEAGIRVRAARLLLGVGAFKGNIATQVGALYGPNDLRRAMAFQIFYIFINVSVIVAPLISGTLGQKVGWHYGFGCAGVVMVHRPHHLPLRPQISACRRTRMRRARRAELREPLSRDDWMCVLYLVILIPVMAIALLTNQEIFNAYLVWGDQQFDLRLLNNTSSWLITVDATVSFTMLVAVAAFWKWWGTKRREPDEISKMIIGSVFTIAGGLCLFMAALTQPAGGKISLFWPMMFQIPNSIGFAHMLPISLALFSKISPKQITATVIGLYYLSFFIANAVVGWVGGLYSSLPTTTFWLIHVASAVFGLVAFFVFKLAIGNRMESTPEEQAEALS